MKTTTNITPFMHTMTTSLSTTETQLFEYNSRLSTIDTCLCNMFTVSSTPNPSFLHTISLANEIPTREEVVITSREIHMPPSSSRWTATTTTSTSQLAFTSPPEKARKLKKDKWSNQQKPIWPWLYGCVLHTSRKSVKHGRKKKNWTKHESTLWNVSWNLTLDDFSMQKQAKWKQGPLCTFIPIQWQ